MELRKMKIKDPLTEMGWSVVCLIITIVGLLFLAWLGFGCAGNTQAKWVETEILIPVDDVFQTEILIPVDTVLVPEYHAVEIPVYYADPCEFGNERFPAVYFETNKAKLLPEYEKYLKKLLMHMDECSELRLVLLGHADERGDSVYNHELGMKRAEAVQNYFLSAGIDSRRLLAVSYGETRPIEYQDGCGVWQLNRRVEIIIR